MFSRAVGESTMPSNAREISTDASDRTLGATEGSRQQRQVLKLLSGPGSAALTMAEMRERGVRAPGQAIYELELAGYPVERVYRDADARHNRVLGYRLATDRVVSRT
jgi:TPP-dependent 2-oxoacid decarboxylase